MRTVETQSPLHSYKLHVSFHGRQRGRFSADNVVSRQRRTVCCAFFFLSFFGKRRRRDPISRDLSWSIHQRNRFVDGDQVQCTRRFSDKYLLSCRGKYNFYKSAVQNVFFFILKYSQYLFIYLFLSILKYFNIFFF